jgi:2Fe-2S ferredoxin
MPKITFATDGTDQTADVPAGWSPMEGAMKNGLRGILADCGGACSCATCQVIVPEEWAELIPPAGAMKPRCWNLPPIPARQPPFLPDLATEALDGMVVHLPAPN